MISSHDFYKLKDGTQLRIKVVDHQAASWIFCLHGLGEHLDRHTYVESLLGKQFNYVFLDHRGHGMSGGKRAYIDSFETFAKDLREVILSCLDKFKITEYGIYAHSMGSLVACDFYKNFSKDILRPSAIFLSSPAVGFPGLGKVLGLSGASLTGLIKDLPMSFDIDADNDQDRYSHDAKALYDLMKDPLVNQHTESKLMMEIVHRANEVFETAIDFQCPVSAVVASSDKVVCPHAAIEYFTNKEFIEELVIVPGGYHELFVEIEKFKAPFMRTLKAFFEARLSVTKSSDVEFSSPVAAAKASELTI